MSLLHNHYVNSTGTLAALFYVEADALPLAQCAEPVSLNRTVMNKDVPPLIIFNKTEPLFLVKPLHFTLCQSPALLSHVFPRWIVTCQKQKTTTEPDKKISADSGYCPWIAQCEHPTITYPLPPKHRRLAKPAHNWAVGPHYHIFYPQASNLKDVRTQKRWSITLASGKPQNAPRPALAVGARFHGKCPSRRDNGGEKRNRRGCLSGLANRL